MKKKSIDNKKLQILECERKLKEATKYGDDTLQLRLNSELRDLKNEYKILQEKQESSIWGTIKTSWKQLILISGLVGCCIYFTLHIFIVPILNTRQTIAQWVMDIQQPDYILESFSDDEYYHLTNNVNKLGDINSVTIEYKTNGVTQYMNLDSIDDIYYIDIKDSDIIGLSINSKFDIIVITY